MYNHILIMEDFEKYYRHRSGHYQQNINLLDSFDIYIGDVYHTDTQYEILKDILKYIENSHFDKFFKIYTTKEDFETFKNLFLERYVYEKNNYY